MLCLHITRPGSFEQCILDDKSLIEFCIDARGLKLSYCFYERNYTVIAVNIEKIVHKNRY